MSTTHAIKQGVSLYSYQEEFFLRKLSLEGCIREVAAAGATGIESIAEQMMPGFGTRAGLSDDFYARWHDWMQQYGVTASAHDAMLDTKKYKDRLLTDDECMVEFERDLKHAARLGCKVVRVLCMVSPEIMIKAVPIAEKYDVKMGIEVHAPYYFDHPWIMRHLDAAQKLGTKHYGLVPDMGIYTKRLPRVVRNRFERLGANPKILDFVCEQYEAGVLAEYTIFEARKMGGGPLDVAFAEQCRHSIFTNPKRMSEYVPYIFHIHAKFYEMLDDGTEFSIPYELVVPELIKGGYDGYLSSEYEGNRHIQDAFDVDSVEQVRRQHAMFRRLLSV